MRPIDADALKEALLTERDKIPLTVVERYSLGYPSPNKHGESMRGGIRKALRCMENTPTLDYAPVRHGEWQYLPPTDTLMGAYSCTLCGLIEFVDRFNARKFCPNCGAKMDGGKKDG